MGSTFVTDVEGDLLATPCRWDVIVQQVNGVTVRPHGLSAAIAAKYKYANVYASREPIGRRNCAKYPAIPGTAILTPALTFSHGPIVAHLVAQYAPGKPGVWCRQYPSSYADDATQRATWFAEALDDLARQLLQKHTETERRQTGGVSVSNWVWFGWGFLVCVSS